jgi:hypothetical protein
MDILLREKSLISGRNPEDSAKRQKVQEFLLRGERGHGRNHVEI